MARFPSPIKDVTRARVGTVVKGMLRNPLVGDVDCMEQTDHRYLIHPRPRIPPPTTTGTGTGKKRAKKTIAKKRKKTTRG